jgi:hypothetical protein
MRMTGLPAAWNARARKPAQVARRMVSATARREPAAHALAVRGLGGLATLAVLMAVVGCGTAQRRSTTPITVPTASAGTLHLASAYPVYQVSAPIGITVSDTGSTTFYSLDSYSSCTIIHLQRSVKGGWQDVLPCASGQRPSVVAIAPTSTIPYTLAPGDAPGNPNAWVPGIYRAVLMVSTRSDGANPTVVAYSTGFRVGI